MDTNNLLFLSDQILINIILPRFPYNTLQNLFFINIRFKNICRDEDLWRIKISNEFPTYCLNKPNIINWRNFYRFMLGRVIPVYYNGDRLGYIPFNQNQINIVMHLLINVYICCIQNTNDINIIFIDRDRNLVINVEYPSQLICFGNITNNYETINKVLIISNKLLSPPQPTIHEYRKTKINKQVDNKLILNELTSQHGNPPIYGKMQIIPYIRSTDEIFVIIDKRNSQSCSDEKICNTFNEEEIHSILRTLGVNYQNGENLYNIIRNKLEDIGHMI